MEFKRAIELILVSGEGEDQVVLMSRRGPAKHGAGTVAFPGGHIEINSTAGRPETLKESALREIGEELGDELAQAAAHAFELGRVTVAACIDMMQENGVYYQHVALQIRLPEPVAFDVNAVDNNEHVDLRWRTLDEIKHLTDEQIYPSHREQLHSFLTGGGQYIVVDEQHH